MLLLSCLGGVCQFTCRKITFPFSEGQKNKKKQKRLRIANIYEVHRRCSSSAFSKVLAARKTNLITAVLAKINTPLARS